MPVSTVALMCHAPIVVPGIAGERAAACAQTTQAMQTISEQVVNCPPDVLVVMSPHTPRHPTAWTFIRDRRINGTFAGFGHPEIGIDLPGATRAADDIMARANSAGLETRVYDSSENLDHGALVPLIFLAEASWRGPTLVIGLPYPHAGTEERLGIVIGEQQQCCAVIASGDMSHRLQPGAPAGFHPRAREFDQWFVQQLQQGAYKNATEPNPSLRDLAAEDERLHRDAAQATLSHAVAADAQADRLTEP